MHDWAGTAITVATVLGTSYFGFAAISALRADFRSEMQAFRSEMLAELRDIRKDMREFYGEQRQHDARITNLEQHR